VADAQPFSWSEVSDSESPSSASYALDEQHSEKLITVDRAAHPNLSLGNMLADILGYPKAYAGGKGGVLSRKLPWQHPETAWLWATKIGSVQGRKFKSKSWSPAAGRSFALYSHLRMRVLFSAPPYFVKSDAAVGANPAGGVQGAEWHRYVSFEEDTQIENITRRGNTFRWAKVGPNNALPPGIAANQPLDVGLIRRVPKALLKIHWHQVPALGLVGPSGWGRPFNLLNMMGRVNNRTFPPDLGVGEDPYPAQTLLFLKPTRTPETVPVPPEYISGNLTLIARSFHVTYLILYFDPPTDQVTQGANPPRGHNLAPHPGGTNPFFYLITGDTAANSPRADFRLYPQGPFEDLFRLNYPTLGMGFA
jgi:hypothetical protein